MGKISSYGVVNEPQLGDKLIGTSVGGTPVNGTYNFTLQQLLTLFLPEIPANTLQQVLDAGNTAIEDITLDGNIILEDITINGILRDSSGLSGTNGQLLSSTLTGTEWIDVSSFDTNIYNSNGTLTSNRTVTMDGNTLSFDEDILVNGLTIGKGLGNTLTNTAIGNESLNSNTTGFYNTAIGSKVLKLNTTGTSNTGVGYLSLTTNTTGGQNSALGYSSLQLNTTGQYNTAVGNASLYANTTGQYNTALGQTSLQFNTIGNRNTSIGHGSLLNNTEGNYNVALGDSSLQFNTVGNYNVSIGYQANTSFESDSNCIAIGYGATTNGSNKVQIGNSDITNLKTFGTITAGAITYPNITGTVGQVLTTDGAGNATWQSGGGGGTNIYNSNGTLTGNRVVTMGSYYLSFDKDLTINSLTIGKGLGNVLTNTALGNFCLSYNTTGAYNTAVGYTALYFNTIGSSNTALGYQSLYSTTTGSGNTGIGFQSLYLNTSGAENIAIGSAALYSNIIGNNNLAIGNNSLNSNESNDNVAIGHTSLLQNATGYDNVSIGSGAMLFSTTGYNNTAIGSGSLQTNTTGNSNIAIGHAADVLNGADNNSIVIGATAVGVGSNTVVLGNTSITSTRLRGSVLGGSFVKDGGTSSQFLMADGSVSNNAIKSIYSFTGSLSHTGTVLTVNLLTITIPANSVTDYINFANLMFSKTGVAGGCQFKIWTGTTNVFASATQIANYTIATPNLFGQMNRVFSINSNILSGFPSNVGNATGDGSSSTAIQSTTFDPTVTNYIFISVQLDNAADGISLEGIKITN